MLCSLRRQGGGNCRHGNATALRSLKLPMTVGG